MKPWQPVGTLRRTRSNHCPALHPPLYQHERSTATMRLSSSYTVTYTITNATTFTGTIILAHQSSNNTTAIQHINRTRATHPNTTNTIGRTVIRSFTFTETIILALAYRSRNLAARSPVSLPSPPPHTGTRTVLHRRVPWPQWMSSWTTTSR